MYTWIHSICSVPLKNSDYYNDIAIEMIHNVQERDNIWETKRRN